MIAALALAGMTAPDDMDLDAFVKAVGGCDKPVVTATITAEGKRHSQFLVDAYKEQRAIALARVDLVERRRVLRAKEAKVDTEEGLKLANEALDDRTKALADTRALDQTEQDMIAYFRTQYLRQCSGKGL